MGWERRGAADPTAKTQFDQFKNRILKFPGDAEVFWKETQTLQTTKNKAIRLVREQKYQLDPRKEELQQIKNEVRNFKSHLMKAITKIKALEKEKPRTNPSQPKENPAHAVDLNKTANNFDSRLGKREGKI